MFIYRKICLPLVWLRILKGKQIKQAMCLFKRIYRFQMSSIAARTWGKPSAQSIKTIFFQKPDGSVVHCSRILGMQRICQSFPIYLQADNQGNITSYAVYDSEGLIVKRVDVTGAAHANVPTPHVIEYGRNTLPDGTVRVQSPSTKSAPRPAKLDEIP
ncbi:polymorphic toxin type 24 domain-containing protein [Pseudomonas ficuserectae]|uniref:polymorphic toxin type 24 domain-containing protein n=1 Tax=Pseudomonas ficuserectae TaxID=53410 RepID=UPI0012ED787F|nr:polymorphic toxin type 24 domain-containing protein [Pseudomonas ficuserectae]